MTTNDYPFVRAWGRLMGSHQYYIDDQVELARQEQAPANATHRRDDGTWATTDEIVRAHTRQQLGLDPLPLQAPEPATLLPQLRTAVLWIETFRDRFGMTAVDQLDERTLLIRFATGWTVRLTVELNAPES